MGLPVPRSAAVQASSARRGRTADRQGRQCCAGLVPGRSRLPLEAMASPGFRAQVEAIFAEERARRAAFLAAVDDDVRAWVPYDATPTARGIELLAVAVGIEQELAAAADAAHRANPAVLHGRVFGRGARLERETILAAFAAAARVRAGHLARLAEAIDGLPLRRDVEALLQSAGEDLDDVFAAQEGAVLLCAERLDAIAA